MSLAPVDVLEEDAADLQFPKDSAITVAPTANTIRRIRHYIPHDPHSCNTCTHPCRACQTAIREPYIQCAECPHRLCLQCFAAGREVAEHRNNHAYIIRHDNVRVFAGSTWTAGEEKHLLGALSRYGHGNWSEIARSMNGRLPAGCAPRFRYTADECEQHYERHYFGGLFEQTCGLTAEPYQRETVPYLYRMNSVDPPRQEANPDAIAGYRAARGEFDVPYDNSAESMVSHLDSARWFDEPAGSGWREIGELLQCGMVQAYNNRLRERQRRYDIMRDHGLLQTSRTLSWLSKHAEALGCGQASAAAAVGTSHVAAGASTTTGLLGGAAAAGAAVPPRLGCAGRFISLMQLCQPIAFDLLVEAMQYAHDLRKYVFRLYDLRRNGVRTFHGGRVYHRHRARRLSRVRNKREEQYAETWEWKQLVPAYDGGLMQSAAAGGGSDGGEAALLQHHQSLLAGGHFLSALAVKRKSTPLEILGLPGYEKLTEAERELCCTVRLVPLSYLGYKTVLMAENSKSGYLRLADARRLIKIDVNKTRQLYDFLLKQGFINKLFN